MARRHPRLPSQFTTSPSHRANNPAAEGFEVTAAWSVAGVGTCIQLRHRAFGLHIAFDMGTSAGEASADGDRAEIRHFGLGSERDH